MLKKNKLIFLIALLFGCSDLQQRLDPKTIYPRDIRIEVNSVKGVGTLVVPRLSEYKIKAKTAGNLDLFMYSTCHRAEYQEEAWDEGWFKSKNETEWS